jgi:hypothetical protein
MPIAAFARDLACPAQIGHCRRMRPELALALRIVGFAVLGGLAILAMVWPFSRPRKPRDRSQLSYTLAVLFGMGALILLPLGRGHNNSFFFLTAVLAWVFLGVLWINRRNPQIPNPDWLRAPWSAADWGLIVILVFSIGAMVWA